VIVVTYFPNGSGKNLDETRVDATILRGEYGFISNGVDQEGMGGV
jgi:hypothetical protein